MILPGESQQDYDDCRDELTRSCKPRNEAEVRLLGRAVRAVWVAERAERVNELRIIELCEQENECAEIDVHKKMKWLFHDPRGPLALYGLTSAADGGPRTSSHEKPADDEKYDPFVLVKQIEASPMGCQKLAEQWGELRSRIEQGLGFQAPDRLRMIRMVGKSPVMAALDEVVAKIYVASFAIYPFGCKNAYEDLKADANDEEFKLLVERIRSRSPLVLDASDTAAARQFLLDLIDRNLERLEAKLEVHRQRAEEYKIRNAARAARDETPEGEMARRHEMACDRRIKRCMDLFWKLRRETERDEAEIEDGDEGAEVEDAVCSAGDGNFTAEAEVESEVGERVPCAAKNVTNDANLEIGGSEVTGGKQVVEAPNDFENSVGAISGCRERRDDRFRRPVAGKGLIDEAIFCAGRCCDRSSNAIFVFV